MSEKQSENNCLNCDFTYKDENHEYCPSCGQKRTDRLTMKSIFENLFSSYFSLDARIINTIGPFLFYPGKVAREYIDGKRKSHLSPSQLYFFFSFILLLFISTLFVKKWESGISETLLNEIKLPNTVENAPVKEVSKDEQEEEKENPQVNRSDTSFSFDTDGFTIESDENVGSMVSELIPYIDEGKSNEEIYQLLVKPENQNQPERLGIYFVSNLVRNKGSGLISLLLSQVTLASITGLLLTTLLLKLLYVRRKFSIAEHFVHLVYLVSFYLVLTLACIVGYTLLPSKFWIFFGVLASLVYLYKSMAVVYQQGLGKTFLKFALLFIGLNFFILPVLTLLIFGLSFFQYSQ